MDTSVSGSRCRLAAFVIFSHAAVMFAGITVLREVFGLPAEVHGHSYSLPGQAVLHAVYWLLAVTGVTQIAFSVLLHRCFRTQRRTLFTLALTSGVAAGIFQAVWFIGNALTLSYPAALWRVTLVCLGLWTVLLAVGSLGGKLLDNKICVFGVAAGVLTLLLMLVQPGLPFEVFGKIFGYGFPAWILWLTVVAVSLLKTGPDDEEGPLFGWHSFTWTSVAYILMILPNLL